MSKEIFELLKLQYTDKNPNSLTNSDGEDPSTSTTLQRLNPTYIDLISKQLASLVCKSLKTSTKNNNYINFVKELTNSCPQSQHAKQCINNENLLIYIRGLPIAASDLQFKEFYLDLDEYDNKRVINKFYEEQYRKNADFQKQKDDLFAHVQKSFPPGFDCVPTNLPQTQLFQFTKFPESKIQKENLNNEGNSTQRSVEMKFAMAILNSNSAHVPDQNTILENILWKLHQYKKLLLVEKSFIKFFFDKLKRTDEKEKQMQLIEDFPFILEDAIIKCASNCLQMQQEQVQSNASKLREIITNNVIRAKAIEICYELFALSNYNEELLKKLLLLIQNN